MNSHPLPHPTHRTATRRPDRKRTAIVRLAIVAAVTMFAALLFVPASAEAQTALNRDASMESAFLSSLNQQRASRGVAPLSLLPSMSSAAGGWTAQMVNGSFLAHASDIKPGVPGGWSKIGENVGRGKSVASLTQSFMASPGHARNVLDPDFTHVGIAVIVHPTGRVYTTHRFAALGTPPAPPAPAPAAPTPPAPAAPAPPPAAPALPTPPPAPPAPPTARPAVAAPPAPAAPPSGPVASVASAPSVAPPAAAPSAPTMDAINAAAIRSWDNIDQIRAAAARKGATVRGARQLSRIS